MSKQSSDQEWEKVVEEDAVEEQGEGAVLVDWSETRTQPLSSSLETPTGTTRVQVSHYDSDSSDDNRREATRGRTSLLLGIRNNATTDDEGSVDEGMILSDEDELSEEDILLLDPPFDTQATFDSQTLATPRRDTLALDSLTTPAASLDDTTRQQATAALQEDKPWRDSPWKRNRRSRRSLNTHNLSDDQIPEEEVTLRKPKGLFRSISLGGGGSLHTQHMTSDSALEALLTAKDDHIFEEELSIEDEDDIHEEEHMSVQSAAQQLSDLDLEEDLDWDALTTTPNSFLSSPNLHPRMSQFLDERYQRHNMSQHDANQFAVQHSLFLRAILQLLQEKDVRHSELDIDALILKQGTLKKNSHRPAWKVNYVEVRRGSFSYYENAADCNTRQTIILAECICQEVNDKDNYVFELICGIGSPKRLFMCSSEEERQAWMRVIDEAKQEKKRCINLEPYEESLRMFKKMQEALRTSVSKSDYMTHLLGDDRLRLQLPIQWVLDNAQNDDKPRKPKTIDFWKFLDKQAIVINGYTIPSDSLHGPERAVGALTRAILEYDYSSDQNAISVSPVQAVSYARDVLTAVCKSRARDDSHYSLDSMCRNNNLVICLPLSEDPNILLHISYARAHGDDANDSIDNNDDDDDDVVQQMSGWVTTRSKGHRHWKNRFCVVSEGVLSYYDHANPRPHGLRGQVVLVGAFVVQVVEEKAKEDTHLYILQIVTKDHERERQLSFRDEESYHKWKDAIEQAIHTCTPLTEGLSPPESPNRRKNRKLPFPNGRVVKKGIEGGGRIVKGAAEGGIRVIKGASVTIFEKITRHKTDEKRASIATLLEASNPDAHKAAPASVDVKVESWRHYKIITADPAGNDEDTWAIVKTRTLQHFRLSGGPNGRFMFGEDIVELDFFDGLATEEEMTRSRQSWSYQAAESQVAEK